MTYGHYIVHVVWLDLSTEDIHVTGYPRITDGVLRLEIYRYDYRYIPLTSIREYTVTG